MARELDRLQANWLNPPEWTREEILEFPGSPDGPWARYITPDAPVNPGPQAGSNTRQRRVAAAVNRPPAGNPKSKIQNRHRPLPPHPRPLSHEGRGGDVGTVRYPRLVPKDAACAKELKKRTLTNLYNQRPQWLALAHDKLDAAVFAAYGWSAKLSEGELLAKLLALNLARSAAADPSP